ncbi:squalene cyclase [Artemisia annua]|uniref:Squalene cyclase n=1 Tax=Artemisia annua TaxID=35608 RepID=A0A2U1LQ17_ARTAN|nr:squalene cyclase [Artemisia annua]
MSYLYGRKYHDPITDLVLQLRQEIHLTPCHKINWNKQRHTSDHLLKYWPVTKLREKALKRTLELTRYNAEESSVEKEFQIMCWWAENPNRDVFKHHLARLPDYLWLAEDGMKSQTFGSQLWTSAFATQATIASNMPEEYGDDSLKKSTFYLKESQLKQNPSDCTGEALKCLLLLSQMSDKISGEKVGDQRLYDAVNFLLYVQSPTTGGFAVWEPLIPHPYLQTLNPSEMFADIVVEREESVLQTHLSEILCILSRGGTLSGLSDRLNLFGSNWVIFCLVGHVECTTSVIALIEFRRLHLGHREKEIDKSVTNAVRYLENTQWQDGSWRVVGVRATSLVLVKFTHHWLAIRTNIVQTSWAMLGLMSAGQAERDPTPLHKAAKILVNAQVDNGDFPQENMTGASVRNCMLHYPLYMNIFPLMALAEYRNSQMFLV